MTIGDTTAWPADQNRFINTHRAIELGNAAWQDADDHGLLNIAVERTAAGKLRTTDGHEFINMCSCSYLGLDFHPDIVAGGMEGLRRAGTLNLSTSRLRIHLAMVDEVEQNLSDLFRVKALTTISCGAATSGILPLIAAGNFHQGHKPAMAFDKNCHFSMNHIKPICGDETKVYTLPHNDLSFLEDLCKRHQAVAYVADGAYSMGGHTPVKDLLALQDKYGLFLYFDDSHSLSVFGTRGEGFVRSQMDEVSDRTIITASLGKAFGASGGVIMLSPRTQIQVLERFGGPMAWSQCANPAAIGAIGASAKIHRSPELGRRQEALRQNIRTFDSLIKTANTDVPLPIRVVPIGDSATAVRRSRFVYERGFYTSAVFFPIVERGRAGLRVMARADLLTEDIVRFCEATQLSATI